MRIDRSRLRRGWPWLASAVVVVVTATIVTVINTRDDRLAVAAGRFIASEYSMDARTRSAKVALPTGMLTVEVTDALSDVGDSAQWRERRPAGDGSFVGVTTQLTQVGVPPAVEGSSSGEAISTPITVAVVADGRRYPLPVADGGSEPYSPPAGGRLRGYVAVAGSPRDVAVEIGFAGERQTVNPRTGRRDAGRFAELPRTPAAFAERDCPKFVLPTGYRETESGSSPDCIVENVVRAPWAVGLGWAPPGRSWLAVAVYLGSNLDVQSTTTTARYGSTPFGNRTTMTVAGQSTKGSPTGNDAPPERRTGTLTGLFLVARGAAPVPLEVSTTFAHMVRGDGAPASTPVDPSLTVSWKVPVS